MKDPRNDITTRQRDGWLALDDDALLAECHVDTYRASGPGGQKRNKTSSAVRLRHPASGLIVISEESRSQHANKRSALRRLRLAIATDLRPADPHSPDLRAMLGPYISPDAKLRISDKNADYPRILASVLDRIAAARGSVRDVADSIGVSASQLIRFIATDDGALAQVNQMRERADLPRLRRS